jgi:hypothetical protein
MGGAFGGYGVDEKCVQNLIAKPGGKRALGRLKCRWEGNIKTGLGLKGVDWFHLTEGSVQWLGLVNAVVNLRVP